MSDSSSGGLSPADRKLLMTALNAGHTLERFLAGSAVDSTLTSYEAAFRAALEACASSENPLLAKLSDLAPKVSVTLGPKHLMGLLVPLERLSGRAARDEEFLFAERDGGIGHHPATAHGLRVVLCENIRSAFNVGAIFRTAETFGGREIWLSGYTPEPQKTAMGTDAIVLTRRFDRTSDALTEARTLGYKIIVLENAPGATPLEDFEWPENAVVILGNERFGVDSQTLAACDHVVRISTQGQKNSLNVGVAFGVAASGWYRSRESGNVRTDTSARTITPIGFVNDGYENPQVAPRQGSYAVTDTPSVLPTATIELAARFEGRPSNFEQALKDLEGFERAWVVFGFHESKAWTPQVRPPRGDGTKRGLFATRAPHRPNGLGISAVRVMAVDAAKRTITIQEHDLLQGTPIYDIKPYVPGADAFPNAKAGWVDEVAHSEHHVIESPRAKERLDWLETHDEKRLRDFIQEQLRFQPHETSRKRIDLGGTGHCAEIGAHHTIAFRTWRLDYRVSEDSVIENQNAMVEILDVRSGYSPSEMADMTDVYGDKELHRKFVAKFQ